MGSSTSFRGPAEQAPTGAFAATIPVEQVRFLVVDDQALSRHIVGEALKNLGAGKFHNAENGPEALDVLRHPPPTVTDGVPFENAAPRRDAAQTPAVTSRHPVCIITDFSMPKGCGLEVLQAVRCGKTSVPRDTPIVLLTGHAEGFIIAAALELDVNAFIVKPVSRNALQDKVKRALRSEIILKSVEDYQAVELPDETGRITGGGRKSLDALLRREEAAASNRR